MIIHEYLCYSGFVIDPKSDTKKTKSELLGELRGLRKHAARLESDQEILWRDLELTPREEQLRSIFEHSNDAIFLIDLEADKILDANPKACSFLGYSKKELLAGRASMLHPHEIKKAQKFAKRVVKTGGGWTDELNCVAKNGDLVSAEISASLVQYRDRNCVVSIIRDVSDRERLEEENEHLRRELSTDGRFGDIIGASPALNKTIQQVQMVAGTEATVLITGESGTGKELFARAIHRDSNRSRSPLVRVNCASIAAELFESEFFGHIKGAFTGAIRDRIGRFELAHHGTLFLDEVGEIPVSLQSKLLRVLQEGQFERVGESFTRTTDVRIIAATNRDLAADAREGRFREDLYYRLSVFPVEVPPLGNRIEDIPVLARHFLDESCRRHRLPEVQLTRGNIRHLESQTWPGNVRELQNLIERAVIQSAGGPLVFVDDDPRVEPPRSQPGPETTTGEGSLPENLTLKDLERLERDIILRALEESKGRIYGDLGAAARLGLRPTTLAYRIKKLNVHNRHRPAEIRWDSSRLLK